MTRQFLVDLIDRAIDIDQKVLLELELLDLGLEKTSGEGISKISDALKSIISNTSENAILLSKIRTDIGQVKLNQS